MSFNSDAEGFKKLISHIVQYHKDCVRDKNSVAASIAMQQLALLNTRYEELKSKTFLSEVESNTVHPPLDEERIELNQQLEVQARWKKQIAEHIMSPMIAMINATYSSLRGNYVGTLQTLQQLEFNCQAVSSFLDQINKLNLTMIEKEEVETHMDGSSSPSSNSVGIPGVGAVNINMSHYKLDADGCWEFDPKFSISSSRILVPPEIRQFAGKPQPSCVYQWPYGLEYILPRTTHLNNSNSDGLLPLPLCSAEQNRIELGFWKDSFVRLSKTGIESLLIGPTMTQTLYHGSLSFSFGVADRFCDEIMRLPNQQIRCIHALVYLGLLYQFYGEFAVGMHLLGRIVKNSSLKISEPTIKNTITFLVITFNLLSQAETLNAESFVYLVAPLLISHLANNLGQKIGREAGKTVNRLYDNMQVFFTARAQRMTVGQENFILNRI
jgi:hypothetical protein